MDKNEILRYSPLTLAYLGDAVLELLVRRRLVDKNTCAPASLHKKALNFVSATAQSEAFKRVEELLTDEEKAIYRQGRNAKNSAAAKHSSVVDYRRATGFEALFGYLHLQGDDKRIEELFLAAYNL